MNGIDSIVGTPYWIFHSLMIVELANLQSGTFRMVESRQEVCAPLRHFGESGRVPANAELLLQKGKDAIHRAPLLPAIDAEVLTDGAIGEGFVVCSRLRGVGQSFDLRVIAHINTRPCSGEVARDRERCAAHLLQILLQLAGGCLLRHRGIRGKHYAISRTTARKERTGSGKLCAYRKKEEEKESVPQAAHAEKHRGEGDSLHYIVACYCKEIGKFLRFFHPSKVR